MHVSREVISGYTDAIQRISDDGAKELKGLLGQINFTAPVADVREATLAVMEPYCDAAATMSARQSAIFYDELRRRATGEAMGAFVDSMRDPKATEEAVRALMQDIVDGKPPDTVIAKCADRLNYEVRRAAAKCIAMNVSNDRLRPRFARVPAGNETCDFCIMLASRGPVYRTEASAGMLDHYHANCKCAIVPMWNTKYADKSRTRRVAMSMVVDGYDPDALYEQYLELATEDFISRMRDAADAAHERHGGGWQIGLKRSELNKLHAYIGEATSYEDLFKRVDKVDKGPYYLTDKQINELLTHARKIRQEFLSGKR